MSFPSGIQIVAGAHSSCQRGARETAPRFYVRRGHQHNHKLFFGLHARHSPLLWQRFWPTQGYALLDKPVLEAAQQISSVADSSWDNSALPTESDQRACSLADIPFHRVQPITTIGNMRRADVLACRQQVF